MPEDQIESRVRLTAEDQSEAVMRQFAERLKDINKISGDADNVKCRIESQE